MGYITTVMPAEARKESRPEERRDCERDGQRLTCSAASVSLSGCVDAGGAGAHDRVCAQVVADVARARAARDRGERGVRYLYKDAWSVAAGNYSSRFAGAVAGTVHLAAMRVRDKLARIAFIAPGRGKPDDIRFEDGRIYKAGDEASVNALSFGRVVEQCTALGACIAARRRRAGALCETVFWTPENMDAARRGRTASIPSAAYGFAFLTCAAWKWTAQRGAVRIDRYVTAHDAGTLLNPALADGQIRGAFRAGTWRGADGRVSSMVPTAVSSRAR